MFNDKILNNLSESVYSGNSTAVNNLPSWLLKSDFSRNNTDLIATSPSGEKLILVDYFTNFELPSLLTENGLQLKGNAVNYLAGPLAKGQYVQSADSDILSIGEVSTVSGTAKATRLDGTTADLSVGDPVFQGDTIETEGSGAVGLVFLDKTTFSLSDGGKMILDELVFDAATATGSMVVNMVEGAFSFISGEIAKTGPDAMTLETPVVTMGIRGTTVAGKAAVEGNENSFTLLQDADGGVGQISVSNDGGTQVLAQVGATTTVSSFTAAPPTPIILSAAQIQANYGAALNVLPPTPAVAPQPQAAPPPQEETQEEQGRYYCGSGRLTTGRELVEVHAKTCLKMRLSVCGTNAEVAPAQWEYQLSPSDPLTAADDLWMSRYVLQRLAERSGLGVDFSPKPLGSEWNGSGCHTNYSTKSMREENGYDNPMTPEFFQELNEILRELNQLYLDDVFPDFFREAELPGPMATNPMPNVQPTQVAQALPQTGGLTQTEAALLSPEEQIIRQRTRT